MSLFTDYQPELPERARVSILERVVPAVSFGLASISGVVAAVMTSNAFISLRNAENAGMDSIAEALTTINHVALSLLGLSIAIGVAGVVIILVRMSSEQAKASPPGFLYLLSSIPCMISPAIVAYAWSVIVDVVIGRNTDNPTATGAWISQLLIIAILIGGAALIVLPVFSFVPFSARRGKKITALVALAAAVIGISAIAISLMGAANVLFKDPRVTYDPGK